MSGRVGLPAADLEVECERVELAARGDLARRLRTLRHLAVDRLRERSLPESRERRARRAGSGFRPRGRRRPSLAQRGTRSGRGTRHPQPAADPRCDCSAARRRSLVPGASSVGPADSRRRPRATSKAEGTASGGSWRGRFLRAVLEPLLHLLNLAPQPILLGFEVGETATRICERRDRSFGIVRRRRLRERAGSRRSRSARQRHGRRAVRRARSGRAPRLPVEHQRRLRLPAASGRRLQWTAPPTLRQSRPAPRQ